MRVPVPKPAHPQTNLIDTGITNGFHRRQPTLGHHCQAVTNLEQLLDLLRDNQHRGTRVTQVDQALADKGGSADVDAPGRLRNHQHIGRQQDLAANDEFLQVAPGQRVRRVFRAAALDVELLYTAPGERADPVEPNQSAPQHVVGVGGQQCVLDQRHLWYRAPPEALFGDEAEAVAAAPVRWVSTTGLAAKGDGRGIRQRTDIEAISNVARRAGVPLIVDNTLASPYLCRPIEHGAGIVVHSLTKFMGGHGNSMGGAIVDGGTFDWGKDDRFPMLTEPRPEYADMVLAETFGNFAFAIACRVLGLRDLGPAISPFNAFQILTGIETLPLRMQRHSDNALAVAKHLKSHDKVAWVSYAGLEGDENHANQQKYMPNGAGAVFTFGVKGGYQAGIDLVSNVEIFSHLANIGDTRSLIIHPASTTHRQLSEDQQEAAGAGPDVVRLSIGIEQVDDLIADLDQALKSV